MFLNINGVISFGHGLGDAYYLICLLILSIIASVVKFNFFKIIIQDKKKGLLFLICLLLILLAFSLKLTILRGAETPWDGNITL